MTKIAPDWEPVDRFDVVENGIQVARKNHGPTPAGWMKCPHCRWDVRPYRGWRLWIRLLAWWKSKRGGAE